MVIHTIRTFVAGRYDYADSLAFGARQPGLAEHQRHVQVEVVLHRLGIEAVDLQDIGNFAAFFAQRGVNFREFAVSVLN